ncbi:hypothetical protein HK100_009276 [Physocladia obscura]|uniref:Transcription initiation factor TFIID subunit 4 n=1 Tax=Physocladia obscura TaxID=109957 RepID=A0AAD5T453_9FUNG|nr:hypothetical protein HK100_009276 [Physocladia obscura]
MLKNSLDFQNSDKCMEILLSYMNVKDFTMMTEETRVNNCLKLNAIDAAMEYFIRWGSKNIQLFSKSANALKMLGFDGTFRNDIQVNGFIETIHECFRFQEESSLEIVIDMLSASTVAQKFINKYSFTRLFEILASPRIPDLIIEGWHEFSKMGGVKLVISMIENKKSSVLIKELLLLITAMISLENGAKIFLDYGGIRAISKLDRFRDVYILSKSVSVLEILQEQNILTQSLKDMAKNYIKALATKLDSFCPKDSISEINERLSLLMKAFSIPKELKARPLDSRGNVFYQKNPSSSIGAALLKSLKKHQRSKDIVKIETPRALPDNTDDLNQLVRAPQHEKLLGASFHNPVTIPKVNEKIFLPDSVVTIDLIKREITDSLAAIARLLEAKDTLSRVEGVRVARKLATTSNVDEDISMRLFQMLQPFHDNTDENMQINISKNRNMMAQNGVIEFLMKKLHCYSIVVLEQVLTALRFFAEEDVYCSVMQSLDGIRLLRVLVFSHEKSIQQNAQFCHDRILTVGGTDAALQASMIMNTSPWETVMRKWDCTSKMELFLQALQQRGEMVNGGNNNNNDNNNNGSNSGSSVAANVATPQAQPAQIDFAAILGNSTTTTNNPNANTNTSINTGADLSWLDAPVLSPSPSVPARNLLLTPAQQQLLLQTQQAQQQHQQQLHLQSAQLSPAFVASRQMRMLGLQQQAQLQLRQQHQTASPSPHPQPQPQLSTQQQVQDLAQAQAQARANASANASGTTQEKFQALLAKVPKDKFHMAQALIVRLKTKQITIQQFAEAIRVIIGDPSLGLHQNQTSGGFNGTNPNTPIQLVSQQQQAPPQLQQQTQQQLSQRQQSDQQKLQVETPTPAPAPPATTSGRGKKAIELKEDDGRTDVTAMMDIGNFGVDIREEEDLLVGVPSKRQSAKNSNPLGFDRSKLQNLVNLDTLRGIVEKIAAKAAQSDLTSSTPIKFTNASLEYMALALQQRMQNLVESTIEVAKHRSGIRQHEFIVESTLPTPPLQPSTTNQTTGLGTDNDEDMSEKQPPQPATQRREQSKINPNKMYVEIKIINDVKVIFSHLEKAEKASEAREKTALHPDGRGKSAAEVRGDNENGVGGEDGDDSNATGKKRKKKESAKAGMSETVKTKLTNNTALMAAGKKGLKSWMIGGAAGKGGDGDGASGSAATQRKKRKAKGEPEEVLDYSDLAGVGTFTESGPDGKKLALGRQMTVKEMCRVTLKDCVFALEHEPQMRSSNLLYKWMGRIS